MVTLFNTVFLFNFFTFISIFPFRCGFCYDFTRLVLVLDIFTDAAIHESTCGMADTGAVAGKVRSFFYYDFIGDSTVKLSQIGDGYLV